MFQLLVDWISNSESELHFQNFESFLTGQIIKCVHPHFFQLWWWHCTRGCPGQSIKQSKFEESEVKVNLGWDTSMKTILTLLYTTCRVEWGGLNSPLYDILHLFPNQSGTWHVYARSVDDTGQFWYYAIVKNKFEFFLLRWISQQYFMGLMIIRSVLNSAVGWAQGFL